MAANLGLTHVLQIDADGQHDINQAEPFFELSKEHPEALICGYPEYDATVPKNRLTGRKITNTMLVIETLSHDLKDGMCGFRVYPVESTLKIKNSLSFPRMGFDIDILVNRRIIGDNVKILTTFEITKKMRSNAIPKIYYVSYTNTD